MISSTVSNCILSSGGGNSPWCAGPSNIDKKISVPFLLHMCLSPVVFIVTLLNLSSRSPRILFAALLFQFLTGHTSLHFSFDGNTAARTGLPNPCIQNGRQLTLFFFRFTIEDRQFAFAWTLVRPPSELEQIVPSIVVSAIFSPLKCVWIFSLKNKGRKKKVEVNEKLLPFPFNFIINPICVKKVWEK